VTKNPNELTKGELTTYNHIKYEKAREYDSSKIKNHTTQDPNDSEGNETSNF
jgi:hypothetical protein